MKKMTIKEYAGRERISIFATIKKIQSGELKSIEEEDENGKIVYIVEDHDANGGSFKAAKDETESVSDMIRQLKKEIAELKNTIEKCCKKIETDFHKR